MPLNKGCRSEVWPGHRAVTIVDKSSPTKSEGKYSAGLAPESGNDLAVPVPVKGSGCFSNLGMVSFDKGLAVSRRGAAACR